MKLLWTAKASSDLARLHEFLSTVNKQAAARSVQKIAAATSSLLATPRIGEKLDEFAPREVRRILVGRYEVRYEVSATAILILRLWHTRENR